MQRAIVPELPSLPPDVAAFFRACGQQGAASRTIVLITCVWCGHRARGLVTRRYCDDACRQAAHRQRHKRA